MIRASFLILALIISAYTFAEDYSVPEEYWSEMKNYSRSYEDCDVRWHTRTNSFFVDGEGCGKITTGAMRNDAISQIEESRKKVQPLTIATELWETGCLDFKKGLAVGDFSKTLNVDESVEKYPHINRRVKVKLYFDGWNMAKNLDGFLSCQEIAGFRAASFIEGVDINETP